ncbi:MAG: ABC transporter permease [Planctomycetaceae bacterium]
MNASLIHRALLRKELRQLAPLLGFILLMACGVYVVFEWFLSSMHGGPSSPGFILLAMPALFSVGAGALSVSQEKETRTLGWLASLPLSPQRLVFTKFAAALIGWAVLWSVVVLSALFIDFTGLGPTFRALHGELHPIYSYWLAYWVFNSFYLLVCGFLTAWRFGTSMTGLVAFVPFAIAPAALRFSVNYIQNPGHQFGSAQYDASVAGSMLAVAVALLPAVWLLCRFAMAALAPQPSRVVLNPYDAPPALADPRKRSSPWVLGPNNAMLWHAFRQNQTIYLSLLVAGVMVWLPVWLFADSLNLGRRFGWEPLAVGSVFLSTAWMGVMAFQGDNLQERIRFLAERGVSPAKAWTIRMVWPLTYISLAVLGYALVLREYVIRYPEQDQIPLWLAFAGLLIVLAYSQWFAQLVRNPMLSAIGAPVTAGIALSYVFFAYHELAPRVVYSMLLVLAPLAATLLMMRRWMDRRFQWPFWVNHFGLILIAASLPIVDFAWQVANTPGMPDDAKVALRAEARSIEVSPHGSHYVSLTSISLAQTADSYGITGEADKLQMFGSSEPTSLRERLAVLKEQAHLGLHTEHSDLLEAEGNIALARVRLDQHPEDKDALRDYRIWMEILATVAQGLRRSVYLMSQERADDAEIMLIDELQRDAAKERLGAEIWDRYAKLVSDPAARNRARRRAVVASWAYYDALYDEDKSRQSLGGFYPADHAGERSSVKRSWTYTKRVDHLAWTLIRYLDYGPTATDVERRLILQESWPSDFDYEGRGRALPGWHWFGDWEQEGAKLLVAGPAAEN